MNFYNLEAVIAIGFRTYLTLDEMDGLNRIVSMYLDYAENQAKRRIPMTMEDWANKLNAFLQFNEYELLNNAGKVTAEICILK